jgi:hypothetical protein
MGMRFFLAGLAGDCEIAIQSGAYRFNFTFPARQKYSIKLSRS